LQGWQGFRRANGLATWETYTAVKGTSTLRVTALPARHARGAVRWMLPPVMGSLVEFGDVDGPAQRRLYLTGDTVMYDGVREIARRIGGGVDLTVVHLGGAVLPGGVMVSMDAVQGVELVATILPRLAVPVHVDDYDVCRTTVDGFRAEVERRGMEGRVTYVERGETVTF
jgi:L-ascorbate metabolism protein UlaG (beta-lactamase superfamily)